MSPTPQNTLLEIVNFVKNMNNSNGVKYYKTGEIIFFRYINSILILDYRINSYLSFKNSVYLYTTLKIE